MPACILTDNTAHVPPGIFPGQRLIKSLTVRLGAPRPTAPTMDDFLRAYHELENEFSAILVLAASSYLLPYIETARLAAARNGGRARISVLDSQQTGAGLGLLTQIGAQAAAAGHALAEIEERIRAAIPHIYTLIYSDVENLPHNRNPHPAQIAVKGMQSLFPLYTLENGKLAPYKKVRTRRHLLESFEEFIEEFEYPQQIALLRGHGNTLRRRSLREVTRNLFPHTPFGEIEMSAPLTALFGPQAIGITVMEMPKCPSVL